MPTHTARRENPRAHTSPTRRPSGLDPGGWEPRSHTMLPSGDHSTFSPGHIHPSGKGDSEDLQGKGDSEESLVPSLLPENSASMSSSNSHPQHCDEHDKFSKSITSSSQRTMTFFCFLRREVAVICMTTLTSGFRSDQRKFERFSAHSPLGQSTHPNSARRTWHGLAARSPCAKLIGIALVQLISRVEMKRKGVFYTCI